MESYFSISEAAKIVGLTSETLRHYDRIDLVKPCKKDQWSGYRYYSEQEIVRLNPGPGSGHGQAGSVIDGEAAVLRHLDGHGLARRRNHLIPAGIAVGLNG